MFIYSNLFFIFVFIRKKTNKMSDLQFIRVYSGRITSIRQAYVDTLGYRGYEVMFSGKKLFFQCHKKRTLPISVNQRIRFCGKWMGEGNRRYFEITEVLDDSKIEMMESQNLAEVLSHQEKEEALAEGHFLMNES